MYSRSYAEQDIIQFGRYYKDGHYPIAYNSMLVWLVSGGTNFWKDIPEKYRTSIQLADSDVLKAAKVNEQTTQFEYQIQCTKPRSSSAKQTEQAVNLTQGNQVSRTLLRPALHNL